MLNPTLDTVREDRSLQSTRIMEVQLAANKSLWLVGTEQQFVRRAEKTLTDPHSEIPERRRGFASTPRIG